MSVSRLIKVIFINLFLAGSFASASSLNVDPVMSDEEAIALHQDLGDYGSQALQEYENRYGKLNDAQRAQFLKEEAELQSQILDQEMSEIRADNPTMDVIPASSKARLELRVSKSKQRLSLYLDGKPVNGLTDIKISTGKSSRMTPNGKFSLKGKEIVKKRINRTFTRKLGRKIYLEDAIQIQGGVFFHKASTAAQKNTLGKPASHGCVRMDRNKSSKVFSMAKKYKGSAVVIIL
ncbi:MAG: hypothetical protein CL676_02845 [Bdellovibrionaceae bacterium]|nr:hypothetical protein [Pseudobdellovibrionaceae bacterium]|tara:strand:- start:6430 stop:7134 length:705 start_codon:yes stop_codon:yes gene_type:complete